MCSQPCRFPLHLLLVLVETANEREHVCMCVCVCVCVRVCVCGEDLCSADTGGAVGVADAAALISGLANAPTKAEVRGNRKVVAFYKAANYYQQGHCTDRYCTIYTSKS